MDGSEGMVTISDKAASKLREIMAEQNEHAMGVRLAVVRTHCMGGRGFANSLAFEGERGAEDDVREHDGVNVYIDQASARYLRGAELDYVETPTEAGFAINNPNVKSRCPCGRHDIFE
jgi:iron-sulfur cluster assembly accessory protein